MHLKVSVMESEYSVSSVSKIERKRYSELDKNTQRPRNVPASVTLSLRQIDIFFISGPMPRQCCIITMTTFKQGFYTILNHHIDRRKCFHSMKSFSWESPKKDHKEKQFCGRAQKCLIPESQSFPFCGLPSFQQQMQL